MIDYNRIAAEYSRHRRVHPGILQDLHETGQAGPAERVLEVGCGTGNYIIALTALSGCAAWGIDPSEGMLARARQASSAVRFSLGRAEGLGFPPEFFNLIFSVDVIHHVKDAPAYFREAWRVLRYGEKICTATDSEEIIQHRRPLSEYFPETVPVELARYPRIASLRTDMQRAGFSHIREVNTAMAYQLKNIQPFRDKAYSCLHLIPEEAFQRGIQRMETDLEQKGSIECSALYVLLWGSKE